jgi:hypothetical protein
VVGIDERVWLFDEPHVPFTGVGVTTVAVKVAEIVLLLVIDTVQVVPLVVVHPVKDEKV